MPDINGIPYVESSDLVSAYPAVSQSLAQAVSDQLASKLPYSYGTATPSTTDSGFLWYDSNSTPPVPKYWNGSSFATLAPAPGLELITTETFSAVSSVSVNGCFSSSYEFYRVLVNVTSTGSTNGFLRLRASGSDDSTSNYNWQQGFFDGTTAVGERVQATTSARIVNGNASSPNNIISLDIFDPFAAAITNWVGISFRGDADALIPISGNHQVTSSYDGFSLTSGATFTGKLRVYGYKD